MCAVACPKPVIETKKVSDANPDVIITTIVDNEVSRDNVREVWQVSWLWCGNSPRWQDFYLTMTPNANPVTEGKL